MRKNLPCVLSSVSSNVIEVCFQLAKIIDLVKEIINISDICVKDIFNGQGQSICSQCASKHKEEEERNVYIK
jgi:hypothetical protein